MGKFGTEKIIWKWSMKNADRQFYIDLQIIDFANSILSQQKFQVSGKESLKVHYLIDAIMQSSKQSKLISLE